MIARMKREPRQRRPDAAVKQTFRPNSAVQPIRTGRIPRNHTRMANSYVRLVIHCVWSTKHRRMSIHSDWEQDLWAQIGGIARSQGIHPVRIGGIENHVHALVEPPKDMPIPQLLEILKSRSSGWINRTRHTRSHFGWQDGYGAFSVSPSIARRVSQYIENQREHHQRKTFEEEYRDLLRWHGVGFEEAYLFG